MLLYGGLEAVVACISCITFTLYWCVGVLLHV